MKRGLIWKLKKRLPKKQRKLLRRLAFLTLDVAIIGAVMTMLTPGLIRADTVTASESFSNTNNINTTSTTANVDTNHTQTRLTNTDSWTVALGIPSSVTLNAVSIVSGTGWAVGSGGSIYKTVDSGLTWNSQTSGVSVALNGVSMASTSVVWAVGASGTILVTTNGGTTWTAQTSGTTNALNGVAAASTSIAWAVGASGTILNTTNGGTTWSAQTSGVSVALNGVAYGAATSTWAVGASGTILVTTNGGTTWTAQTSGTTNALNGVIMFGSIDGVVVGDSGTILTTAGGGVGSWMSRTAPASENIKAVSGTHVANVYMTTASGSIFRYGDPTNITAVTSNTSASLNGISGNAVAVAVGASGTVTRNTAPSTSGAYTVVSGTGAAGLNATSCASSTTCWSVGDSGAIVTSSDSGATWSNQASLVTNALLGVKMVSTSVGWAVGGSGTIIKTSNGSTWGSQTSGTSNDLQAIDAASTSVAWAVGASGKILKTTDGSTWSSQTSGTTSTLFAVSAPSTTVAWVAGASGTALLTTDGGTTWTAKTTGISTTLIGVAGIDSSTAYVVGNSGTILKTTNGGSTWSTLTSGTSANLFAIAALDTNTIRVTGVGVVLQSVNAGSTWSSIATSTVSGTLTYRGITHPAINAGVIAGQGYMILRYIPSYSASSLIVVSNNVNTTSTNIASATLTATATLNSQTITYALSNDGGTTFTTVTSGTSNTFGTTGADLRWRATLLSTDTTATPVLTAISISAETSGSTSSGSGVKDNYNERTADCTTTNTCALKAPVPTPNPGPETPTVLSPTSIRWNFTASDPSGVKLLLGTSDGKFSEIARSESKSVSSIDETGLQANTQVSNRSIQAIGTTSSPAAPNPTALPTTTLPPAVPPAPELSDMKDRTVKLKLSVGANAEPLSLALQEGVSGLWLSDARSFTASTPVWKTLEQWKDTPDGMVQVVGLTPNTSYAFRVQGRGLNDVQTGLLPSIGVVTNVERPATIVPTVQTENSISVTVKSAADTGAFSNLSSGSSGILIENVTTGASSGWIQGTTWTLTDLKPGTDYALQVRTRRNDGIESPPSPPITVTTAGVNEQEQKKIDEEKKKATEQKKADEQKKQAEQDVLQKKATEQKKADEEAKKVEEEKKQAEQQQAIPTPRIPAIPPQPETQPQALNPQPAITFDNNSAAAPTIFGGGGAVTRHFTPRIFDFNGAVFDPTQPPMRITLDPVRTPQLVIRGQSEPNTIISIIIESEPFITTTKSDSSGNWTVTVATALIPEAPEHTISVQAGSGDTASAKVTVATLAVNKPPVQRVTDTVVQTAGVLAEQTIRAVETTTRVTVETTKRVVATTKVIAKKVEPQAQVTLTTVVPILVAFNPPLWALLPQLPVLFTNLFTWLLTLLGIRKRRLPWGIVYDAITKQPIALAIMRVFDLKTQRVLETQVTDRNGRFGVMLHRGSYRLEVTKGAYRFPSQMVRTAEDGMFTNVYRGGATTVPSDGSVLPVSIPLDPEAHETISAKQRASHFIFEMRKAFRWLSPFLLWSGTASGFVLAAASPTPFNIAVGTLYLGLAIVDQLTRPKPIRSWGRVVDAKSGTPIALATVDLIDLKYKKLLGSRFTDTEGRFAFLPPPGQYTIQARKEGYGAVLRPKPIRGVRHLYTGEVIAITEKTPTISATLALEKN